jgi:hypothetical protein
MPTYVGLTYTADVAWSQQSTSRRYKEYEAFEQAAAAVIKGAHALDPTATATTVRVPDGKGGDMIASDGPYAETKEALTGFYCTYWSAPTSTRRS